MHCVVTLKTHYINWSLASEYTWSCSVKHNLCSRFSVFTKVSLLKLNQNARPFFPCTVLWTQQPLNMVVVLFVFSPPTRQRGKGLSSWKNSCLGEPKHRSCPTAACRFMWAAFKDVRSIFAKGLFLSDLLWVVCSELNSQNTSPRANCRWMERRAALTKALPLADVLSDSPWADPSMVWRSQSVGLSDARVSVEHKTPKQWECSQGRGMKKLLIKNSL